MIDLFCKGCGEKIGERDGNVIHFSNIMTKAPCDVMCSKCGKINNIPEVPELVPVQPEPLKIEVVEPTKPPKDNK